MKGLLIISAIFLVLCGGCKKDVIRGCTNSTAANYNSHATQDDGSCKTRILGCADPASSNYSALANVDDGSCTYTGNVTFWYNSSTPYITVYIADQTGLIDVYYSYYTPSCGSSGCANFTLNAGTYSWTAESNYNYWSGTVTVSRNTCKLVLL